MDKKSQLEKPLLPGSTMEGGMPLPRTGPLSSSSVSSSTVSIPASGSDSDAPFHRVEESKPQSQPTYRLRLPKHIHLKPVIGMSAVGLGVITSAFAIAIYIAALSQRDKVSFRAIADMTLVMAGICIFSSLCGLYTYAVYHFGKRKSKPPWEGLTQSAHDVEIQLLRFLICVCMVAAIVVEIHVLLKHSELEERMQQCHDHLRYVAILIHVVLWIIAYLLMGGCVFVSLDPEFIDHLRRHRGSPFYVMHYVLGTLFWIMVTDTVYIFYVLPENKLFLPMHGDSSLESRVIFTYYPLLAAFNMHIFFAVGLAFVLLRKRPARLWEPVWKPAEKTSLWQKLKRWIIVRKNSSWLVLGLFVSYLIAAPFTPLDNSEKVPGALIAVQIVATGTKFYLVKKIGRFSREKVAKSQEMRVLLLAMVFFMILNAASILRVIFKVSTEVDRSVDLRTWFRVLELVGVPVQAGCEMYFLYSQYTHSALNSQYDRPRIQMRKLAAGLFCFGAMCNITQYYLSLLLEAEHLKYGVASGNCSNVTNPEVNTTAAMTTFATVQGGDPDEVFGHFWYIIEVACVPWIVEVYLILAMLNVTSAELIRRIRMLETPMWYLRYRLLMINNELNTSEHARYVRQNREVINLEGVVANLVKLEQYALRTTNCKQLLRCDVIELLLEFKRTLDNLNMGDANRRFISHEEETYNGLCKVLCVMCRYKPAREVLAAHEGGIEFLWRMFDRGCLEAEADLYSRVAGAMWMYTKDTEFAESVQTELLSCSNPQVRRCSLRDLSRPDSSQMRDGENPKRRIKLLLAAFTNHHPTPRNGSTKDSTKFDGFDYEAVSGLLHAAAVLSGGKEDEDGCYHFLMDEQFRNKMHKKVIERINIICSPTPEGTALELGNNIGLILIGMEDNFTTCSAAIEQAGTSMPQLFNIAVDALISRRSDARSRGYAAKLIGITGKHPNAWDSQRRPAILHEFRHCLQRDPDDTQKDVLESLSILATVGAEDRVGDSLMQADVFDIIHKVMSILLEKVPHGRLDFKRLISSIVANALEMYRKVEKDTVPSRKGILDLLIRKELNVWIQLKDTEYAKRILCACVGRPEFWTLVTPGDVLSVISAVCKPGQHDVESPHERRDEDAAGASTSTSSSHGSEEGASERRCTVGEGPPRRNDGVGEGPSPKCDGDDRSGGVRNQRTEDPSDYRYEAHVLATLLRPNLQVDKESVRGTALAAYFKLLTISNTRQMRQGVIPYLFYDYNKRCDICCFYVGNLLGLLVRTDEFWEGYHSHNTPFLWDALTKAFPYQLDYFEDVFQERARTDPNLKYKANRVLRHYYKRKAIYTMAASEHANHDHRPRMLEN